MKFLATFEGTTCPASGGDMEPTIRRVRVTLTDGRVLEDDVAIWPWETPQEAIYAHFYKLNKVN